VRSLPRKCPWCGQQIPDGSEKCPHCDWTPEVNKNRKAIRAFLFFVIVSALAGGITLYYTYGQIMKALRAP